MVSNATKQHSHTEKCQGGLNVIVDQRYVQRTLDWREAAEDGNIWTKFECRKGKIGSAVDVGLQVCEAQLTDSS